MTLFWHRWFESRGPHLYATVAQLVEQLVEAQRVGGSSPPGSTRQYGVERVARPFFRVAPTHTCLLFFGSMAEW